MRSPTTLHVRYTPPFPPLVPSYWILSLTPESLQTQLIVLAASPIASGTNCTLHLSLPDIQLYLEFIYYSVQENPKTIPKRKQSQVLPLKTPHSHERHPHHCLPQPRSPDAQLPSQLSPSLAADICFFPRSAFSTHLLAPLVISDSGFSKRTHLTGLDSILLPDTNIASNLSSSIISLYTTQRLRDPLVSSPISAVVKSTYKSYRCQVTRLFRLAFPLSGHPFYPSLRSYPAWREGTFQVIRSPRMWGLGL